MTDLADAAGAPTPPTDIVPCWSYYATRRNTPDPATPVDRWAQGNGARDLREVVENIAPLVSQFGVTTLVEPFAGMGSGALAARHLGIACTGSEISRSRALRAQAKAFLTSALLEEHVDAAGGDSAVLAALNTPASREDGPGEHGWVGPAVAETVAGIAARLGSPAGALDIVRRDLATAPAPHGGAITPGDFRDLPLALDGPALFDLCPPYPRVEKTGSSPTGLDGAVHCQTPALFDALATSLAEWLGRNVREQDVVVAEYLNALPRYDAGSRLAEMIAAQLGFARIVPAATENQRGTVAKHPSGYCGFILASRRGPVDVPEEWFGTARADVGQLMSALAR